MNNTVQTIFRLTGKGSRLLEIARTLRQQGEPELHIEIFESLPVIAVKTDDLHRTQQSGPIIDKSGFPFFLTTKQQEH